MLNECGSETSCGASPILLAHPLLSHCHGNQLRAGWLSCSPQRVPSCLYLDSSMMVWKCGRVSPAGVTLDPLDWYWWVDAHCSDARWTVLRCRLCCSSAGPRWIELHGGHQLHSTCLAFLPSRPTPYSCSQGHV